MAGAEPSRMSPVEEATKCMEEARSFNVLVTGKTGTGKSTLINKLLGFDASPLRQLTADTAQIGEYTTTANGVDVCIWDSPGLQDGTPNEDQYLQDIEDTCSQRDLTLYCIKCGGENRFVDGNPDVVAMKKLTAKFGVGFWSNTVIVLTHANSIGRMDDDWEKYSEKKKGAMFKKEIKEWQDRIRNVLRDELKVHDDVHVPIVPAGQKKPHLPNNTKFWLTALLGVCVDACKSNNGKAALLKLNTWKITEETYDTLVAGCVAGPTLIGGAIGAVAVGGLTGLAGGAAVGVVVGLAIRALVHFMTKDRIVYSKIKGSKKTGTPEDKKTK